MAPLKRAPAPGSGAARRTSGGAKPGCRLDVAVPTDRLPVLLKREFHALVVALCPLCVASVSVGGWEAIKLLP